MKAPVNNTWQISPSVVVKVISASWNGQHAILVTRSCFHRLLHVDAVDGHVACSHRGTPVSSPLESPPTSRSHRPDSSAQARSLHGADRLLSIWLRDPERQTQVTNRFRIVLRINPSLSSPCTNPHNSRSRQHMIAGDHAPMTKPLSMITRCHFFFLFCAALCGRTTSRVFRSSFRPSPVLQEATQSPSHWSLQLDVVPLKHLTTRSSKSSHQLPRFSTSALWKVKTITHSKSPIDSNVAGTIGSQRLSSFPHNLDWNSGRLSSLLVHVHPFRWMT